MSSDAKPTNSRMFGVFLAVTVLTAYLFLYLASLLAILPLLTYFIWSLHLRVRDLERQLADRQPAPVQPPQ